MRQFATDLFNNGAQGKVLKKNSSANMDFGWNDDGGENWPEGGNSGDVLTKDGNDVEWLPVFPEEGDNGNVLVKDGDYVMWRRPDDIYPKLDLVYRSSIEKTVVAKVDILDIENALQSGSLSASFEDGTLTLNISNDSDESISVWFDLYFDVAGDYTVGTVSSEAVNVSAQDIWNLLEVRTNGDMTIAAGETETITIALTGASGANTEWVFTFEFPQYVIQSEQGD